MLFFTAVTVGGCGLLPILLQQWLTLEPHTGTTVIAGSIFPYFVMRVAKLTRLTL